MKHHLTSLLMLCCSSCLAPDVPSPYIQLLGGESRLRDGNVALRGTALRAVDLDISDQPVFGMVQQVALNRHQDRWVDLGIESGALVSWENERTTSNSGLGTTLETRTETVWIDGFLGPYVAMPLFGERLRLYAAAGPLLLWGYFEQSVEDLTTGIETEEDEYSLRVGAYARAGAELRIFDGGYLGVGVRAMRSKVDFAGLGELDVKGTQYFLSYSMQF